MVNRAHGRTEAANLSENFGKSEGIVGETPSLEIDRYPLGDFQGVAMLLSQAELLVDRPPAAGVPPLLGARVVGEEA